MNIINLEGGSAEPPEPPSGYGPEWSGVRSTLKGFRR